MASVIIRTPPVSVQLLYRDMGNHTECRVIVGLDGQECYQLGPFKDVALTLCDAMQLVTVDQRMNDTNGLATRIDSAAVAAKVSRRMGG